MIRVVQYIAYRFHRFARAANLPRVEHLYVFYSLSVDLLWRSKIGISIDGETRRDQVESSINKALSRNIRLRCAAKVPVLFARKMEGSLHRALPHAYSPYRELAGSSGWSEWFYSVNKVVPGLLVLAALYFWNFDFVLGAAIVLALPLPIDFIIFVLLIFVCQWGAIVCAAWWAVKIVF